MHKAEAILDSIPLSTSTFGPYWTFRHGSKLTHALFTLHEVVEYIWLLQNGGKMASFDASNTEYQDGTHKAVRLSIEMPNVPLSSQSLYLSRFLVYLVLVHYVVTSLIVLVS
jgi:hypothetical protein